MKLLLLVLAALVVGLAVYQIYLLRPGMSLDDAKAAVQAGTAVLIDVREPTEWTSGVAKQAALLPFSELRNGGGRWREFLDEHRNRRLFLYCVSGTRSGMAAKQLRAAGFDAINVGSLRDWNRAGWPVYSPTQR